MENEELAPVSGAILRKYMCDAKTEQLQHVKKASKKKAAAGAIDEALAKKMSSTLLDAVVKAARQGLSCLVYPIKDTISDVMLDKVACELQVLCPGLMIIMNFGTKEISVDWAGNSEA